MYDFVHSLLELVHQSVSPWHTAKAAAQRLEAAGYARLDMGESWQLVRGGRYYTEVFGSAVLAFAVGGGDLTAADSLRLAAAHTDFPGLRIKPAAGMVKDGYGILNVESYGGMILHSWQDRPLSIAGRVAVRGEKVFAPEVRLADFARPLLVIPELAIHMNRKVNEGTAIKKQKEMLPLMAVLGQEGEKSFFEEWLAGEMGVSREDILSYELNLYPYEAGCQLGMAGEMVSAPRLDNLTSVEACLQGMEAVAAAGQDWQGLRLIALFDNEEIGSRTKQGAGSAVLMQVLERIYAALGYSRAQLWQAISGGFMLSVDVAHGLQPNYPEKYDATNRPVLNGGVVLKQAASQSYAGDAEAVAIVSALCCQEGIACQRFVNHSDEPGGSTLGSIASALVPMRTMDIGVPLLSMHSARETMGAWDQDALNRLLKSFVINF
ncbi:MAG: M18 family aminopeptidase [Selenomonadaceae bacterium]|nr:M18 family aminopeptidase [Selenomonadaceae bacterium]